MHILGEEEDGEHEALAADAVGMPATHQAQGNLAGGGQKDGGHRKVGDGWVSGSLVGKVVG